MGMGMADGEPQRVRRVVLRQFGQREKRLDHPLDLLLLREAVAADCLLHPARLVFVDGQFRVRRRRQHRIQTLFAFVSIVLVVAVAGGIFSLLVRYTQIEQMIVEQRKLTAEIDDQQKRLEELQVEINRQGNIAQIQDYARQNLNMDYAQKENTRVIALP